MQIHNYHLSPIDQICLPITRIPQKKFVAWASNNVLSLFAMDEDRPLKVMRFSTSMGKLLYLGKNEVLAFKETLLFKIDLNEAQPHIESKNKANNEWVSLIKQRLMKNSFAKKQL